MMPAAAGSNAADTEALLGIGLTSSEDAGTKGGEIKAVAAMLAKGEVVLMLYGGLADDVPSKYVTAADGALIMDGAYPYDAQTFSNSTKFLDFFAK